jgi:hypothetical protein
VLILVGFLSSRSLPRGRPPGQAVAKPIAMQTGLAPAIYALQPSDAEAIRNGPSVQKAIDFLTRLQPEGGYILSRPGESAIVPMDLAHAAIALAKVGRLQQARAAMTWLYRVMIRPGSDSDDSGVGADYAGSWYDSIQPDGQPSPGASRGRGEAVGMSLIATYTIVAQDSDFLHEAIGGAQVADLLRLSVHYLTQPIMQAADGSFAHSPDYRVSFNEECARMSLGLRLASDMLASVGDMGGAARANVGSVNGIEALRRRTGLNQGMAYDYYAMGIWGLATQQEARSELDWLQSTGLVDANGVRNWDWQLRTATSPRARLGWWLQAQTIAPSQTFDYAIASVAAGNLETALDLERRWLRVQRDDGGFDDAYLFGLQLGFSPPTSYAVARFLLLERLLTDVVGSAGVVQSRYGLNSGQATATRLR